MDYDDSDRPEMLRFIPSSAQSVLDVGCWRGSFGQRLKAERRVMVTGVEQDEGAAEVARTRLDTVVVGLFPDAVAGLGTYDCVVFNDVLEHMEDPWAALRAAHGVLEPGGRVIASIPNVRHFSVSWPLLKAGSWTYTPAGILDQTHLRFFTKSSMQELFESSGYTCESIDGINPTPLSSFGRMGAALRLLRSAEEEFVMMQYAVVARSHSR